MRFSSAYSVIDFFFLVPLNARGARLRVEYIARWRRVFARNS